jgi:hypothetical protein
MKRSTLSAVVVAACLLAAVRPAAAADDATLFRLFFKDGTTLVSYGEFARVGDRVVFSMPVGAADASGAVPLHLVNIAADRVDWDRTNRYTDSARTVQYFATQAEADYAAVSNDVARTLNEVAMAPDAAKRLALVEDARKALAEWPRNHYNYRAAEVRQMLTLLDEAITDLRAASSTGKFDLALSAFASESPLLEPMLPPPTPRDAVEQTLLAARLSESASEREGLLDAALWTLDRNAATLPADWAGATRADAKAALDAEHQTDRRYETLSKRIEAQVRQRVRRADVRGLEQMLAAIQRRDAALGHKRPDEIGNLVASVQARLDAVRALRLARDRWAMRAPAYRTYRAAISAPVDVFALFARVTPALEDVKALAGSPAGTLAAVHRTAARILARASAIDPPAELQAAHALLVSAAQMAQSAVEIRREATLAASMPRAWDASSAAAGSLMLAARARSEIQSLLRPPPLR